MTSVTNTYNNSFDQLNKTYNDYQDLKQDNINCDLPRITDEMYYDGNCFINSYIQAQQGPPIDSTPDQEHWRFGPPNYAHYTQVPLTQIYNYFRLNNVYHNEFIPLVIGRNGCNLSAITYQSQTHYIWYNNQLNAFEFWGPRQNLQNATNLLYNQINWVLTHTHLAIS